MRRTSVTGYVIASSERTSARVAVAPRDEGDPVHCTAGLRQRQRRLLEGQNAALELIADGTDLALTLCHLCHIVEQLSSGTACSVLLLVDGYLRHGAGPSLPAAFTAAADGLPVGPAAGSCGTAAYRRLPVAVHDIASDPLWEDHRTLALTHGLRACWSYPILARGGTVLGTFAVYHREPRSPREDDWQTIADIARLARIAIERDQKDRALRDSTAQIRHLTDNLPGVVYRRLTLPDGSMRYTYVSDSSRDLFGLSPDEILADPMRLHQRIEVGYRAEFHRQMLAASRALNLWETEVPISAPDGTRRWIQAIARPQLMADGSVVCDGIALDITRRKMAENAAAAAQGRLQEAIESISDGFALYDRRDRIVAVNQRYTEIYPELSGIMVPGVKFETIVRTALEIGIFPVPETQREAWIVRRKESRRRPTGPLEFATGDGRHLLIDERRTRDGGIVTIHKDITLLKQRDAEMRRQSLLLQQTLENLDIGVSVYDHDLKLVALNQSFCELMGFPQEFSTVGKPLEDFLRYSAERGEYGPGDVEQQVAERMARARQFLPEVSERARPNGTIIEVRGNPMPYGGFVTSYADITERHQARLALKESEERQRQRVLELEDSRERLERQGGELVDLAESLSHARDEAEAASRTKSEFLANMSHELRTPLNAVIGFSEIMMGEMFGPLGDPRYRDYAKDMHDSGAHLLALINDILDLSKVEAGRLDLNEGSVDVGRVVATCHRLVRERAVNAGVAITLEQRQPLPPILADEIKLKQILLNLLSNAVKFTPRGGKVVVETGCTEQGDFRLQVIDNGIGMKRGDIPLALQPFRQIDSALSRKHSGTGLGLPLTKALVVLHGGNLTIDSDTGRGTIVTVILPAARFTTA